MDEVLISIPSSPVIDEAVEVLDVVVSEVVAVSSSSNSSSTRGSSSTSDSKTCRSSSIGWSS